VLNGNSTVQLTDLATKAGSLGLPNFSVQDAGKTQVRSPSFYTATATGMAQWLAAFVA